MLLVCIEKMPPWPPDTLYREYSYQNTLSIDEINTITDWIANGLHLETLFTSTNANIL